MNVARTGAFLIAAAFTGTSATSLAAPRAAVPVHVTEDLHQGCPRTPTMLERVRARLPRVRAAEGDEPAIDVEVRVERRDGVSHGTVALVGGDERTERAASSPSCDRVLAALAIMAAIGLDEGHVPPSTGHAPSPSPSPSPGPSPTPAPGPSHDENATVPADAVTAEKTLATSAPRSTRPKSAEARPSEPAPRLAGAIGTSLELSANRAAVVTPGLFGQIAFPLRFEPFLRVGIARSFREESVSARGTAGLVWTEGTVAGCADLVRRATVRAGPCVNVEAGSLQAIVIAPPPSRGRTRLWLSAGASARIAWRPLSALSFEIVGGLRVPLVRNQLFFEPLSLVYEAPLVVPFVGTAAVAHLP